ncbi:MAG: agmatine deiminase family protein [Proteobacteria bacterium]|nr:agmatine deiminase family protein [Pseudomonadota bacterium]
MNTRRLFLNHCMQGGGLVLLGPLLSACGGGGENSDVAIAPTLPPTAASWLMPDEGAQHKATWMAFIADEAIWGRSLQGPVQDALARIANAIVQYEPVNMLVRQQDLALAKQKLGSKVRLIVQDLDDLWLRDTGPVFVSNQQGERAGVNFNFNGWGKKQVFSKDSQVAAVVTGQAGVRMLSTKLVLEGGGIEVDGKGTAIITESCVLNANRNPGLTKAACEAELKTLLGIRKVIWLPGIAGKDITDGHTDFYARFTKPGVVVCGLETDPNSFEYAVTQQHLAILRAATDADNQPLQVNVLGGPRQTRPQYAGKDFAAGYINFYVANGAVFIPEFGDAKADEAVRLQMKALFPSRVIVQINIDPIAAGGGGIHCTTQQEPA